MKNNQRNIPDGWKEANLSSLGDVFSGLTGKTSIHFGKGSPFVTYMNVYSHSRIHSDEYAYVDVSVEEKQNSLRYGDVLFTTSSETPDEVGIASVFLEKTSHPVYLNSFCFGFRFKDQRKFSPKFAQYYFRAKPFRDAMAIIAQGAIRYNLSKKYFLKTKVIIPEAFEEQESITQILGIYDKSIKLLMKKIQIKKEIKRGLMQELLTCKTRLSGYTGKWGTLEIGDALDYEQPTKYIVKSTQYSNVNKVPVLTANKAFILGYTDELDEMYDKILPVIIFDDFTTDKKFVSFPFKVKSSAIKILTPRNNQVNIKYIFERMQLINFTVGQHKRHYLSEYQFISLDLPKIEEQNAIVKILATAEREILNLENKLALMNDQKKYLLNNLITGIIRTPETLKVNK